MAISAVNATQLYNGPTLTGQIVATNAVGGDLSRAIVQTGSCTLDGVATTFTHNFIDGTNVLPFTPSAVLVCRSGAGNAAATVFPVSATSITATSCTITLAAAGTSTNTMGYAVVVLK